MLDQSNIAGLMLEERPRNCSLCLRIATTLLPMVIGAFVGPLVSSVGFESALTPVLVMVYATVTSDPFGAYPRKYGYHLVHAGDWEGSGRSSRGAVKVSNGWTVRSRLL
jgi:hypothetical protein